MDWRTIFRFVIHVFFIYDFLICLELKRRAGDEDSVLKQVEINRQLDHAMVNLKKRKISQIS